MSEKSNAVTYQELLNTATSQLYDQSDSPRIDAEVLLQHVVKGSMAWLISHGDSVANGDHIQQFLELIDKRHSGIPVAYLVGHKEFWSLDLKVNEHVLVPRSDTETLVEQALELLSDNASPKVLDLGTGSGAIALAIAKEIPSANITAVDASHRALQVATENAHRNKLDNVTFLISDWFDAVYEQQFDLIAANPPYVAKDDPHLNKGDLRFEPNEALAAERNGLSDLSTIITGAPRFLKAGGHIIVEHGFQQHDDVRALLEEANFECIQLHSDLNNLPRCTSAKMAFSSIHEERELVND